ncbi:MAG: ubiquitin carboxyl-terminal hydrolase family protein [Chlamydiota bacterium]
MTNTITSNISDRSVNDYLDGKTSLAELKVAAKRIDNQDLKSLIHDIGVRVARDSEISRWKIDDQKSFIKENIQGTSYGQIKVDELNVGEIQRIAAQILTTKTIQSEQLHKPRSDFSIEDKIIPSVSETEPRPSPKGLPNLGVTCFANATLQLLFHTPGINDMLNKEYTVENDPEVESTEAIIQQHPQKIIDLQQEIQALEFQLSRATDEVARNENKKQLSDKKGNLSKMEEQFSKAKERQTEVRQKAAEKLTFYRQLGALKREYDQDAPNQKTIKEYLSQLWKSPILNNLNMTNQQDATEFLTTVLDAIRIDFNVKTQYEYINPNQGDAPKKPGHIVNEAVNIPILAENQTLQHCLDSYLETKHLEKDIEGHEGYNQIAPLFIEGPPETFQFSLNRLMHDGNEMKKIETVIKGEQLTVPFRNDDQINKATYQLETVVCHKSYKKGDADEGHYYTLVRTASGWTEYNDSDERKLSDEDALKLIQKEGYVFQTGLVGFDKYENR